MRGDRLAKFGGRVLQTQTFELIAAPAIADLQFEAAAGGFWRICRGYGGAWRALFAAVAHDSLEALPTFAVLVLLQACYYTALLTFIGGLTGVFDLRVALPTFLAGLTSLQLFSIVSVIALLSIVPVAACYWPRETP